MYRKPNTYFFQTMFSVQWRVSVNDVTATVNLQQFPFDTNKVIKYFTVCIMKTSDNTWNLFCSGDVENERKTKTENLLCRA